MWTAPEFDQLLKRIARQGDSSAPVLSGYFNRDEEGRLRFEQQAARCLSQASSRNRAALREAIGVARGLFKMPGQLPAMGFFVRGGERMFLFHVPLALPLDNRLELGRVPALYEACRILDDYHQFRLVHLQEDRVDIAHFELGRIDFQLSFRAPYRSRTWRTAMMEVLRQAQYRYKSEAPPWLLAAPEELLASGQRLLRGSMAHLAVARGATLREIVPAVLNKFREVEEAHSQDVAQQLIGISPHLGPGPVLSALLRQQVATVALAARTPQQTAMLHEDSVWFAKRAGVDVEIVKDSAELNRVGGIACL